MPSLGRAAAVAPVIMLLTAAAAASPWLLGWISVASNRLVSPRPVALAAAHGVTAAVTGFMLCCLTAALLARRSGNLRWAEATLAVAAILLLTTVGLAAEAALAGAPRLARVAPSAGVWLALAALILAGFICAAGRGAAPGGFGLVMILGIGGLAWGDVLAPLSLLREADPRSAELRDALTGHVILAGTALMLALAVTLPLSVLALTRRRLEAALLGGANGLQVVPSIALFGLLIGPLSFLSNALPILRQLGLAGVGAAPAILGIAAYLVLPLARATLAGLRSTPPEVMEAARGQGMSERDVLRRVRLPLGAPVILSGVRLAAVQAVGLATLGALVGGGGLGTIVFAGIGQFASDLILLGVLPIVALSLLVDAGLATVQRAFSPAGIR